MTKNKQQILSELICDYLSLRRKLHTHLHKTTLSESIDYSITGLQLWEKERKISKKRLFDLDEKLKKYHEESKTLLNEMEKLLLKFKEVKND